MTAVRAGAAPNYTLGPQLRRDADIRPYTSTADIPDSWRELRVYAVDPSIPQNDGETALVRIPHEDLKPGPSGGLFEVDMTVPDAGTVYQGADLDAPAQLRSQGVTPDEADARFHGQMVYAIASLTYETFRKALGRQPAWGFANRGAGGASRLVLAPFAIKGANAFYSRAQGRISFGYARTPEGLADLPKDKEVFTSLSSDIITHEVSHAILDGLRPYFHEPTSPDVLAFHEAFADLMAMFQRFGFRDFIKAQLRRANGDISIGTLLNAIAPEIGDVIGEETGVRHYMAKFGRPDELRKGGRDSVVTLLEVGDDVHKRGAVLAEAVFEAFVNIAHAKALRFIGIATGGRHSLKEGELSAELLEELARVICKVASEFKAICIRAVDYCPPVDINFGDYLRAMITADATLVAEDPYGYREALVNAFRRRQIYPRYVKTMSQNALLWSAPERALPRLEELSLGQLVFDGDPGAVPKFDDVETHARRLGDIISASPAMMAEMGLLKPSTRPGAEVEPFEISSVRPARRAGPDGQIAFDLVAEIVQKQWISLDDGRAAPLRGGATLILDARGKIRFIVRKRLDQERRRSDFKEFLSGDGNRLWTEAERRGVRDDVFQNLCMRGDVDKRP